MPFARHQNCLDKSLGENSPWRKAWLVSAAQEQNRCHAPDHQKWCKVTCDEVHHPSWNISPQDAWYTGPCSSGIPGFYPAPHSDNLFSAKSKRMIHLVSVISPFLCLRCWAWLFAMKECVVICQPYTPATWWNRLQAVCVSVVLSTPSHWLSYDISWISNSVY